MAENIKKINRFITIMKSDFRTGLNYKYELAAIEHLIKAYKELEEENSLLIQQNITYKRNIYDLKNKNIPVSLVEEKIEELNEYYKKEIYPSLMNWSDIDITEYYDGMIGILQELLEKRK